MDAVAIPPAFAAVCRQGTAGPVFVTGWHLVVGRSLSTTRIHVNGSTKGESTHLTLTRAQTFRQTVNGRNGTVSLPNPTA